MGAVLHSHETHRPPLRTAETLFLELPTHEPCVVRRLSVALPVSLITGDTDPIATAETCSGRSACCGGIANLTMRKCRKRSRGKHTFGTAQDSRQVCLFHLATRGHAENILVPKEPPAMHAPVLHFARLRYEIPLNHLYRPSALLKIATPRTSYLTQCPTTLYIYLSCGFTHKKDSRRTGIGLVR